MWEVQLYLVSPLLGPAPAQQGRSIVMRGRQLQQCRYILDFAPREDRSPFENWRSQSRQTSTFVAVAWA